MRKQLFSSSRLIFCAAILLFVSQHAALAQDHAAKIQEVLALAHKYRQFNGSALVAENGKVIYKGAFGMANMEWNIPNTPDTKFRLGSITKQFTAMLTSATRRAREDQTRRKDLRLLARLPKRHRREGDDSSPADAHFRHSELHRPARLLRKREPQSLQSR